MEERQPEQRQNTSPRQKEREKLTRRYGSLTEASLDLLLDLGTRDAALARQVGQALARERDQAISRHKRVEQERTAQAVRARKRGAELGYPEIEALDLAAGEEHWQAYLANPKHDLEAFFAHMEKLAENIRTIQVTLYLTIENNSKFVRGKGKVRDEIERFILCQYSMQKHPNGVDYTLTIPYETEEQLERIIDRDLFREAHALADARNCYIEADIQALDGSGRHW